MELSLKELLATGNAANVPSDCSSPLLEAIAGVPEWKGNVSRKYRQPNIWKYGDVEYTFSRSTGALELINIDRFSGTGKAPVGWGGLQVEPWVVHEGLGKDEFLMALESAGIAYSIRLRPEWKLQVVVTSSDVEVGFIVEADEFSDFLGLAYISRRVGGQSNVDAELFKPYL